MTHLRETGLVYNNVYPDVDPKSGLIIPKTLVKTEDRPKKQLKTSRHKRKRIQSLDEVEKQLKKPKRVKQQREDWKTQEMSGGLVKEWQPKKKRPKKPSAPKPKKPSVQKPKKSSVRKRKKTSKKSKPRKRVASKWASEVKTSWVLYCIVIMCAKIRSLCFLYYWWNEVFWTRVFMFWTRILFQKTSFYQ